LKIAIEIVELAKLIYIAIFHSCFVNVYPEGTELRRWPSLRSQQDCHLFWGVAVAHPSQTLPAMGCGWMCYPLVNEHNYGKSHFLMGKSTISGNFQ
jgi:hypothetical protein